MRGKAFEIDMETGELGDHPRVCGEKITGVWLVKLT